MSIYASVLNEFHDLQRRYQDDISLSPIIDKLSREDQDTWLTECELDEELRPEHGLKPDFYDILEHEIYARGIEVAPHFGPSSGGDVLALE